MEQKQDIRQSHAPCDLLNLRLKLVGKKASSLQKGEIDQNRHYAMYVTKTFIDASVSNPAQQKMIRIIFLLLSISRKTEFF